MTTFQDPQPQSRRSVRQSERGEVAESTVGSPQFTSPPSQPAAPKFFDDPAAERDMWDTTARRAAQLPPAAGNADVPVASGRRAAAVGAEPATARVVPVQPAAGDLPPTQAIAQVDQPTYRVRDFSPDGRRSAQVQHTQWQAPVASTDLSYQTQARAAVSEIPVAVAPPVAEVLAAPAVAVAAAPAAEVEHTISRREMRAMLAEREAGAPVAAPKFIEPAAPVAADAEVPTQQESVFPFLLAGATPAAGDAQISRVADAPVVVGTPLTESAAADVFDFGRAPEPTTSTAVTTALSEFDVLTGSEPAVAPQRFVEDTPTGVWKPPVGHWSTHADAEDETQVYEHTLSRTIGAGGLTTSALVLPTSPEGSDIRGALTGTGKIMLTGSIDLPQSYSTTGVHDRFEHGGIDSLFDASDADVVSTDSAPVRAIRAVSTHNTSGHGVTHTQKPKGTRSLTALLIAAASMAVVVAGLLVTAIAFNVF